MHHEQANYRGQDLTYVGANLPFLEGCILSEEASDLILDLKFEELALVH